MLKVSEGAVAELIFMFFVPNLCVQVNFDLNTVR